MHIWILQVIYDMASGDPGRVERCLLEELVRVDKGKEREHVRNKIKQLRDGLAVVKIVWQFLKKVKIELPCDPAIPFLCIYPRKLKIGTCMNTCTQTFITALTGIARGGNNTNARQQMDG